ncbi:hypothetical protein D5086_023583 [Populus alba]|uniref:Uncharacterized protein n=1 Tax=Populus alba TaxID=43335 RepID=A0ACC4BBQ8_POPAL
MEKYQIFLPVSDLSSPSGSPSSLNMANPLVYFHGENENGVRPESGTQHSDAKHSDPQTSRVSSNSEIKVKPGMRGGDNNESDFSFKLARNILQIHYMEGLIHTILNIIIRTCTILRSYAPAILIHSSRSKSRSILEYDHRNSTD